MPLRIIAPAGVQVPGASTGIRTSLTADRPPAWLAPVASLAARAAPGAGPYGVPPMRDGCNHHGS
jgi:hypothetical protein